MDWPTEILFTDEGIAFRAIDFRGNSRLQKIEDLPEYFSRNKFPKANIRKITASSTATWELCSGIDYLKNICQLGADECPGHLFFLIREKTLKFVVPALAIIEGFLSPSNFFIPEVFCISSIYSKIILDCDRNWPNTFPLENFSGIQEKNPAFWNRIAWIANYPSARKMVASIHQYAKQGAIGLKLPDSECKINVQGLKVEETYFVTSFRIATLVPNEIPYPWTKNSPAIINFTNYTNSSKNSKRCDLGYINDAEWNSIGQLLNRRSHSGPPSPSDSRLLLGLILQKHLSGLSWMKFIEDSRLRSRVIWNERSWTRDGTMAEIIRRIRYLRNVS